MIQSYRKDKIVRYLDSLKNQWRQFPPSLHIELTDKCFNNCVMCEHWRRKEKLTLDVNSLLCFLESKVPLGLESVCYTGGDPLLHPEFDMIMNWHQTSGVDFGIVTAGYIPDKTGIDLLKTARWIRVSLDAIDNENYAVCRGGAISFDDVDKSIKRMIAFGCNVELGITVHKHNFNLNHTDRLRDILFYAKDIGINRVDVRGVYEHVKHLRLSQIENEVAEGMCNALGASYCSGMDINYNIVPYKPHKTSECYACLYQLFIRANGDIYPCCVLAGDTQRDAIAGKLGNIYQCEDKNYGMIFHIFRSKEIKSICDRLCIKRLDTINMIAGQAINERNFF